MFQNHHRAQLVDVVGSVAGVAEEHHAAADYLCSVVDAVVDENRCDFLCMVVVVVPCDWYVGQIGSHRGVLIDSHDHRNGGLLLPWVVEGNDFRLCLFHQSTHHCAADLQTIQEHRHGQL